MNESLKNIKIGIVGLGYVGLPLAISFAKKYDVVGYDFNEEKIKKYISGVDVTNEVSDLEVKKSSMVFTSDPTLLKDRDYVIIAVPTPIAESNLPDFGPLESSSKTVGKILKDGCIVIYESTVYPGLTEEFCVPILEEESNKKCGIDFKVAYSPERINPGDKKNRFETITKIVSGMDEETLKKVSKLYSSVLKNGVYEASSIKVAEAAKVIENTQRDINIAFMNQLSIIFHDMNIDTKEVLDAAGSKWNFLPFTPGLVGGHCISVDPFYLIYKSEKFNYSPELLKISRKINDGMGSFIADEIVKALIRQNKLVKGSVVLVYGITFKENVADIRNSKVVDIINRLKEFEINVIVEDYFADKEEVKREYNIDLVDSYEGRVDIKLFAVSHDQYRKYDINELSNNFNEPGCIFDIKGIFNKNEIVREGIDYWRL